MARWSGVCVSAVLVNIHDAEDAFQATFLILASRAGAIRRPDALASFLHGVARRLAVRLKQRPRVAPVLVEPVVAEGPATTVSWREVLALLDEELQRLPERYRLPLVLCYLEGATRDEAAQQLGWSLATVRRRVDRGRELLHARLLRRGVTLPAALGGALLTELVVVPPTLTAAALAAARHWLAGPAEHCLISASVLSLARQGALAMGTASLRALLLVGVAILALGGGAGVYFAVRQRPASLTSPPGPAAVVDVEAASLMQTAPRPRQPLRPAKPLSSNWCASWRRCRRGAATGRRHAGSSTKPAKSVLAFLPREPCSCSPSLTG